MIYSVYDCDGQFVDSFLTENEAQYFVARQELLFKEKTFYVKEIVI